MASGRVGLGGRRAQAPLGCASGRFGGRPRTRQRGAVTAPPPWSPAAVGTLVEAYAPCSPQPHERDALLAGSLNTTLHLSNEQERGDWPGDGPKAPELYSHHKAHGRSKHLSGSNVSFSRDTEGGEEEPSKVRGAGGEQPPPAGAGRPGPPCRGVQPSPHGWGQTHRFSGLEVWPGRTPARPRPELLPEAGPHPALGHRRGEDPSF